MKKIFSCFLIMCFSILFFVGCGETNEKVDKNTQEILSTPSAPIVTETNDKIIISTSSVENAKLYQFTINNINFTAKSNILDCTNYILETGVYTIKVTAIGDSVKYLNSQASNATQYIVTEQLPAPVISFLNNKLYITEIAHATNYEIYVNDNLYKTTKDLVIDISSLNFDLGSNTVKVKTVGNDIYKKSEFSDEITYLVTSKLNNVSNLEVLKRNNKYYLSFNGVEDASSYSVYINEQKINDVNQTLIDISSYISVIGTYNVKVCANSNNQSVLNSDYVNYSFDVKEKLQTPNLECKLNVSYVEFEWQRIQNAKTYSMLINNEEYSRLIWSEDNEKIISLISKEYLNKYAKPLKISIKANGYDYYLDSDFSNIITIESYGAFETPSNLVVNNINGEIRLNYDFIENAKEYTISINDDEFIKLSTTYYVDLTDVITENITYQIKVKVNKTDYFDESEYSQVLEFLNPNVIETPKNPKIEIESSNNTAYLSWDEVAEASYYIVKFITFNQDEVINQREIKNIVTNEIAITLSGAGRYGFNVIAVNAEGDIASVPSITVTEDFVMRLTQIKDLEVESNLDNLTILATWEEINNAIGYDVYVSINGETAKYTTTQTYYIIEIEGDEYKSYSFSIIALAEEEGYWSDSNPSLTKTVYFGDIDDGETYFYNGVVRSLKIYSQEELNYRISYLLQCKETDFEIEILLDETKPLLESYYLNYKDYIESQIASQTDVEYLIDDETILNEFLTALYSYNRNIGGVKSFSIPEKISPNIYSFHIDYYFDGTQELTQCNKTLKNIALDYMPPTLLEQGFTPRPSVFNSFYIDSVIETQMVTSSDQLYETIMFLNRKPQFEVNSEVEQIYYKARRILRSIISDEMNDFQKVCAIYDYLVFNVKVDDSTTDIENLSLCYSSYLEGVFDYKVANSFGFSKAFCLLCAIEGINTRYILGYSTSNDTAQLYAINKVNIQNEWYVIDIVLGITKISNIKQNINTPTHYFSFLVSDNDIKDYFTAVSFDSDNATLQIDYYKNTQFIIEENTYDLFIESDSEFEVVIDYFRLTLNKDAIECKISNECDIKQLFDNLLVVIGKIDYKYSNQLYLIKLK